MVVGVVGVGEYCRNLANYLQQKAEVKTYDNMTEISVHEGVEALVIVKPEKIQVKRHNKTVTVDGSNFENIVKAITFMA